MTVQSRDTTTRSDLPSGARTAYLAVMGLASLVVLFQAVWAGLFIHEGRDYEESWVEWHARGADLAILLTVVAFAIGIWKLRAQPVLWIGAAAFAVVLVVEAYLGGLIGKHAGLTVIHIPLAMALMALSVYLPMRAARPR